MTAAPGDDDAPNRRFASQAWLPFPPINPMLELKKTLLPIRINVIGN